MKYKERMQTIVGIVGLALILAGAGLYFYNAAVYRLYTQILLGLGFVMVLFSSFLGMGGDEKKMFDKRYTKYGISTSVAILLIVIILSCTAYLTTKYHHRWDMTSIKKFSLSEQTVSLLERLTEPVEVTSFFEETNESLREIRTLMDQYKYHSQLFSYINIDPRARPDMVEKFGITREGTIVIQKGDKREDTNGTGEVDITGTLMKLTVDRERKVIYFTQGHNECDFDSYDQYKGLNQFKDILKTQNYEMKKLLLIQKQTIPEDAALVVIAGPRINFIEDEFAIVKKYIDNEGRLLILLDPPLKEPDTDRIPSFDEILNPLGVKVEDNFVIDTASCVGESGGAIPVIYPSGWHQITKDFRMGILLAGARSITPLENVPNGVTVDKLGETFPLDEFLQAGSWGETDLTLSNPAFTKGVDQVGPLTVAVAIEKKNSNPENETSNVTTEPSDQDQPETDASKTERLTRVVVIGDSDIVKNALINQLGNSDFILNSISWLCQEEELISIRPKTPQSNQFRIDNRSFARILLIVFVVPLLLMVAAVYIWWKRR